jgi:DNA-binding winged helix-turn-helix (wHTH) protein/Tfp pilus assembly protein PilF
MSETANTNRSERGLNVHGMNFGGFRVDEVHRTVTATGGRVVRLEPKAFDLLAYFAQHPGETLSREQLIADVWGGKFVTEDVVMVAVHALRQAFEDDARSPRFIETIRGRGYRWIAHEEHAATAPAPMRRPAVAAVLTAIAAIGLMGVAYAVLRRPEPMPSIRKMADLVRANARGVFFSERTTLRDLEAARGEFRKAIQIEERFAEPHAALAQVCVRLVEIGAPDADANAAEARREAARAMELGPQVSLSHAARATVQFVLDRDAEAAATGYLRAIALDPSLPGVRRRYSYLLGATGRFEEATHQARAAVEMDPTSGEALADLAWMHVIAGRLDEAALCYRDALRLDPSSGSTYVSLAFCDQLRNSPDAAMQSYRRGMELLHVPGDVVGACDRAYAASGIVAVDDVLFQRLHAMNTVPRFIVALYAISAGRQTDAMAMLREATRRREPATLWIAVHPAFAPLRGQREFAELAASSFHTR